ncbi:MAG: Translation elongation factor 1 beta [Geoglossum simile]|nr:MAG: Translation elongation factor 1 beta [Geoglossum simile]
MSFPNIASTARAAYLDKWLSTRSYITLHEPTSGDKDCFLSLKISPSSQQYPHLYRWLKHIASYKSQFPALKAASDGSEISSLKEALAKLPQADSDAKAEEAGDETDEEFTLSGDDETPEQEMERLEQERKRQEELKMKSKPKKVAMSTVVFDINVLRVRTDLKNLDKEVRKIEMDGLRWGVSKFVGVAYGIQKLRIEMVIEDEKVSTNDLQKDIMSITEEISQEEIDDDEIDDEYVLKRVPYVQSVEIASFQKY